MSCSCGCSCFFFNDTATTEIYTLSLHDALPIFGLSVGLKWEKIQVKFKKLVKKFHPDMNSGNKKYEDKLKVITLAYTQLKNTYREKN